MSAQPYPAFFAYPSQPSAIGQEVEAALQMAKARGHQIHSWTSNDITGQPLAQPIYEKIDNAPFLVADVTRPNINVYFEIGYALGRSKRVHLVSNSGITSDYRLLTEMGIFDTLGHKKYESSQELSEQLAHFRPEGALNTEYPANRKSPIYIVEPPVHNQATATVVSAIKKRARIRYRSFTPSEHIRISTTQAIEQVAQSSGLVVHLIDSDLIDSEVHNLRSSFIAGLGLGLDVPTLILIQYGNPAPLDFRDIAKIYRDPETIREHIADFVPSVMETFLSATDTESAPLSDLASLAIGDPAAENEMLSLGAHYVETDAFSKALRGEVNLVVGRKGMGKTALFTRLRDNVRAKRKNIVIDLKPEGYQLIRLKEEVLHFLSEGTRAHLITAIWEYVLYLEICYKLLEKDETLHNRDHDLFQPYRDLYDTYHGGVSVEQGDFSERLYDLSKRISDRFEKMRSSENDDIRLNSDQITELLHQHDIHQVRQQVSRYLSFKDSMWILFDNLDKGWPAQGIGADDILIIRCLIDAAKKIQRELSRGSINCHNVIFVRNDIYELLISQATDFGKESRVSLDWSNEDLLRELVRKRLSDTNDQTFDTCWNKFFVSHINGEDSYYYIQQRTLMRPRNMIKIISHCKGSAIVRGLNAIDEESILKGISEFSNDVIVEADRELADIEPSAKSLIYHFIDEKPFLSLGQLSEIIRDKMPPDVDCAVIDRIIGFLLYFGFFGISRRGEEAEYIYDFHYNFAVMDAAIAKSRDAVIYCLHPAFWPALKVSR